MKEVEYYIMRHADQFHPSNMYISYFGMLELKEWVEKLETDLNKIAPDKKLRIIHSMLPRAEHTALLMREMLKDTNVLLTPDPDLNSNKLRIDEKYVKNTVSDCDNRDEVCLILSHKPDIEYFCHKELGNSEYLRMKFSIELPPPKDENELPF